MLLDHRRFLAGDPLTSRLFLRAARQWTRKYFSDRARIESVVQAALLEMVLKLKAGENPDPDRLAYWIYGCTHNAVRRELTRMRRETHDAYDSHRHGRAPVDMCQMLQLRRELEHLEQALEGGSEKARQIFTDRVRGSSYQEIATTHGLSEGAARQSVSQLRKRLIGELTTRDKTEYLIAQARRFGLVPSKSSPPDEPPKS